VQPVVDGRPGDVPLYASDCRRLFARTAWRPRSTPRAILEDIFEWIRKNERAVLAALR
jgi:CDP-paratose 2-epimerase